VEFGLPILELVRLAEIIMNERKRLCRMAHNAYCKLQ